MMNHEPLAEPPPAPSPTFSSSEISSRHITLISESDFTGADASSEQVHNVCAPTAMASGRLSEDVEFQAQSGQTDLTICKEGTTPLADAVGSPQSAESPGQKNSTKQPQRAETCVISGMCGVGAATLESQFSTATDSTNSCDVMADLLDSSLDDNLLGNENSASLILDSKDELDDVHETSKSTFVQCLEFGAALDSCTRSRAARLLPQCLFELGGSGAAGGHARSAENTVELQVQQLCRLIETLAHDHDPSLRVELLDHMTLLAGICLKRPEFVPPGVTASGVNTSGFEGLAVKPPLFPPLPPNPLLVRLHCHCLVPSLTSLMQDSVLQVRKTAHSVILQMLDARLFGPPNTILRQVLPTVLELSRASLEKATDHAFAGDLHDQRQEAVTLIAKLVQYVDRDQAQAELLPLFLELCNDPSFHVRRACAVAMIEICQVLDTQCVQNSLLTTFLALCGDEAWSVRKACTESFLSISCVVEARFRREALTPRFLSLLTDSAKWVVASAYQQLGPFISTFADPSRTGLELVRSQVPGQEDSVCRTPDYHAPVYLFSQETTVGSNVGPTACKPTPHGTAGVISGQLTGDSMRDSTSTHPSLDSYQWGIYCPSFVSGDDTVNNNNSNPSFDSRKTDTCVIDKTKAEVSGQNVLSSAYPLSTDKSSLASSTDINFNSFVWWRSSLPEVDELQGCTDGVSKQTKWDGVQNQSDDQNVTSFVKDVKSAPYPLNEDFSQAEDHCSPKVDEQGRSRSMHDQAGTTSNTEITGSPDAEQISELMQSTRIAEKDDSSEVAGNNNDEGDDNCGGVPAELLMHFAKMLEPSMPRQVDCIDLTRSCAFSLPAVALALGSRYWERHLWPLLNKLSGNVQWKVRHSVASSLHILVVIAGDRASVELLVPLFHTLCRDVDEVRLPLLRNFSHLCMHLELRSRRLLLDALREFAQSDNQRVWRLRDELARQISLVAGMFSFGDRLRYFVPILQKLLQDKVSQVRKSAALCFGPIIWKEDPFLTAFRKDSHKGVEFRTSTSSSGSVTIDRNSRPLDVKPSESCHDAGASFNSKDKVLQYSPSLTTASNPGDISSYFDAMELVLRKLYMDAKWGKWQHRQAFARLLGSIVDDVPHDVDILAGADESTIARATALINTAKPRICDNCIGMRNMAVVMKLIRPEVNALLDHRVPNVRLEAVTLLSKISSRFSTLLANHEPGCEPCGNRVNRAVSLIPEYTGLTETHASAERLEYDRNRSVSEVASEKQNLCNIGLSLNNVEVAASGGDDNSHKHMREGYPINEAYNQQGDALRVAGADGSTDCANQPDSCASVSSETCSVGGLDAAVVASVGLKEVRASSSDRPLSSDNSVVVTSTEDYKAAPLSTEHLSREAKVLQFEECMETDDCNNLSTQSASVVNEAATGNRSELGQSLKHKSLVYIFGMEDLATALDTLWIDDDWDVQQAAFQAVAAFNICCVRMARRQVLQRHNSKVF